MGLSLFMPSPESALVIELLETALSQGQSVWLNVSSNSMRPLLRRGDQIALVACGVEHIQVGDVVVMRSMPELLVHRCRACWVAEDGEYYLITRGDRAAVGDPTWPASALLGRVAARRRAGRTLNLTAGPGRWLHRHLAYLAAADETLFLGAIPPSLSIQPASRSAWSLRRWGRALLHRWGAGVDAVLTAATSSSAPTPNQPAPIEG